MAEKQHQPQQQSKSQTQQGGHAATRRETSSTRAVGSPSSGSPFGFLRRFMEDMDRLFDEFTFGGSTTPRIDVGSRGFGESTWAPQIDVVEREGRLVVRADLPGLKKEDVDVEIRDQVLTISGQRREEEEHKEGGVYRRERRYGSFYRTIPLPSGMDAQQAKATFHNGVLEIALPMPKGREGRRIEIQEGGTRAA